MAGIGDGAPVSVEEFEEMHTQMHNLMQQFQTLQLNMPHGDPPPNKDAEIEEDDDPPRRPAGRGHGERGLGFANFGRPRRIPIGGGYL